MNTRLHTEMSGSDPPLLKSGQLVEHYVVDNLICIGGFGQVFAAHDMYTFRRVAVKVESIKATIPLLRNESICLKHLNDNKPATSRSPILRCLSFGETDIVRYLVMEHCGSNLRELKRAKANNQFSISTSLWLMEKMIDSLRLVHSLGWLHRDVKPSNFCIGDTDMRQLVVLDFGMCRYFMRPDGSLKPRKSHSAFYGTVRYASPNTHDRQDICRWDDLWSVFYMTVENIVGNLPWRTMTGRTEVLEVKRRFHHQSLCYGKELCPGSLTSFHSHLQRANENPESFYVEPPYELFLRDIRNELEYRGFSAHVPLDWEMPSATDYMPHHNTVAAFAEPHQNVTYSLPTNQFVAQVQEATSHYLF